MLLEESLHTEKVLNNETPEKDKSYLSRKQRKKGLEWSNYNIKQEWKVWYTPFSNNLNDNSINGKLNL